MKRPPTKRTPRASRGVYEKTIHGGWEPTPSSMEMKRRKDLRTAPTHGWCKDAAARLRRLENNMHFALSTENVRGLRGGGYYALYRGGHLLSIGKARSLRVRLGQHLDSARRLGVHDVRYSTMQTPLRGAALTRCEKAMQVLGGTTTRDREAEDELFWFF